MQNFYHSYTQPLLKTAAPPFSLLISISQTTTATPFHLLCNNSPQTTPHPISTPHLVINDREREWAELPIFFPFCCEPRLETNRERESRAPHPFPFCPQTREEESDLRFISPSIRELVKAENQISFIQPQARARERGRASGLQFLDSREWRIVAAASRELSFQLR